MSSPDDDDDDHVNDDDADHSQDDNDDDDDDRKRFHSQLMDGVLWVLVGLLFVAGITARHCGLLCIVYCVLCIVYCVLCIVYRVSCIAYCVSCIVYCVLCIVYFVLCPLCIVRQPLVGFGDVVSFYPFSRHINQLAVKYQVRQLLKYQNPIFVSFPLIILLASLN